jgi:hypothetical protein
MPKGAKKSRVPGRPLQHHHNSDYEHVLLLCGLLPQVIAPCAARVKEHEEMGISLDAVILNFFSRQRRRRGGGNLMTTNKRLCTLVWLSASFCCICINLVVASEVQVVFGNYSNYVLGNGQQVSGAFDLAPAFGSLTWTDNHVAGASAIAPPGDIWWSYPGEKYPIQQTTVYGPRSFATAFSDAQSMTLIATANAPFDDTMGQGDAWFRLGFQLEGPTGASGSVLAHITADYSAYFQGESIGWLQPAVAMYMVSLQILDQQGITVFSMEADGGEYYDGRSPHSFEGFNEGVLSGDARLLYDTEYIVMGSARAFALLPEPSAVLLLGVGLVGLWRMRKKIPEVSQSII